MAHTNFLFTIHISIKRKKNLHGDAKKSMLDSLHATPKDPVCGFLSNTTDFFNRVEKSKDLKKSFQKVTGIWQALSSLVQYC